QGARCEGRHPPEVQGSRGPLRLRGDVEDALDQAGAAPRNLLELPPVLYRPAEADRYRGTSRALYEEVRGADVGTAEEGSKGKEGDDGRVEVGRSSFRSIRARRCFTAWVQPFPHGRTPRSTVSTFCSANNRAESRSRSRCS